MADSQKLKLIVGVGASAGGLAAFKQLVTLLPANEPMAFVIIQHLDPTHKSMLRELLARETSLKVEFAKNDQAIKANHIYVIPPDTYLEIHNKRLILVRPDKARGFRKAIDHFFRSLAADCKEHCAGIVLSGAGSDGTAGLRAIKAAGGLALAQNPDTAEHSSMPTSAIEAGVIDKVVDLKDIPPLLKKYIDHPLTMTKTVEELDEEDSLENLEEITAILESHEDFNLRQYKPGTVQRRIARRMSLIGVVRFRNYLEKLQHDADERKLLTKDLLINVTDFFRDPEAFTELETQVIPAILKKLRTDEDIRVWVPGCASGEEAYSITILFREALEKSGLTNELKVFATDIDEHAIKIARKGVYSESIMGEVPPNYLEKYFTVHEGNKNYQIISAVRDSISFASQNVAIHPPFSQIHLISCRNLLIYLKRDVQEKVLNSFYFSLTSGGYLLLGSSESIGTRKDFFKTVSKKWRLYQKLPGREDPYLLTQDLQIEKLRSPSYRENIKHKTRQKTLSRSDHIRRSILNEVVPPMIVVDAEGRVLYNHGKLKPYMTVPTGEPRNDVTQLVLPSIRSRLRSGLYKVRKCKQKVTFRCSVSDEGDTEEVNSTVRIELVPLRDPDIAEGEAIGIVFYEESPEDIHGLTKEEESKVNHNLELELAETREELQNTIEELETSTEELKASHEEALSTNEELQSANEELEAGAEELRSLNEELSTVNAQLKEKIQALQDANNDVQNFFDSTDLPTIFLNPDLEIQRYTPAAELLLKMGPRDEGRSISTLGRDLIDKDLIEECKKVLRNFQPFRREKQSHEGRWFIRQVTPYRTEDRRIEGVVIVFQDVTEMKLLSRRAEGRERQQSVVAKLGMLALSGVNPEELMEQAVRQVAHVLNADYCKVLKYQPEEGNLLLEAGVGWQNGLVGNVTVPAEQGSQAGYTLLSRDPVIVKDLSEEKRFHGPDLLIQHDVTSGISCLINHSNPPYGVLGVHTKNYVEFSADDANFLVSVANMLSTAIKAKEDKEKLFVSEEKFRIMANAIPQMAWMTDEKGYIFWFNQRWYDYTGTTIDDVEGWGWQQVHHPDHVDRVSKKFRDHVEMGEAWEDTFPLRGADGIYRWFLSRATPIRNREGEIYRWLGTNTDINKQLELEESLKLAVSKLEETDQRKNEFLAILGHELRNPLAAIKGSSDLLEAGIAEPDHVIKVMQRSIDTMARLLDDLLDLSRISRNKIKLEYTQVDVSEVLRSKVHAAMRSCEAKRQTIKVEIADGLHVNGDETRLEQIFSNLLNNACKYTQNGGEIEVKAGRSGDQVIIAVKDNGVGIDNDAIDKIFEPFYQITPSGKAASGLGIGLSLVKNLVELHGGQIRAHSEGRGYGTYFEVVFPASVHPYNLNNNAANEAINLRPGLRVVMVDDNPDILSIFTPLLESLHCEVLTAVGGEEAVELIKREEPDCAFVDLGLPDISGYEVASRLRKSNYSKPLVAASGYSHEEARIKSEKAGFTMHLAKPFSIMEMKHILARID